MTRSLATLTDVAGDLSTELASVRSYQRSSKARQTVRVYDQAWRSFTSWCQRRHREALPAQPETVAAYLATMANVGYSFSTIGIHRAAISAAHRAARLFDPSTSEDVRDTVDGISRQIGTRKRGSDAIMPSDLLAMVRACDRSTLSGQRDAAMLIVGWFGGFRRSELVAVAVDDITINGDAMTILVRRSKTDQSGEGLLKHFPRLPGNELCPIAAVRAWRNMAGLAEGPLFRRIERDGTVSTRKARRGGLTDQYVDRLIKRTATDAQVLITEVGGARRRFSGHSLRVGLLTAADEAGVAVESMSKQVGHRRLETTVGYQRKGGASIRRGIASIFKHNGSEK